MADADSMMSRIGAAMELSQRGEREEAREAFTQLWQNADAPLHRCAIAHALADVQDDPREELAWDLRALDAVADVTDEDAAAAGMTSTAGAMRPSLHLNLGEDYRKLGELAAARRHLELGLAACDALPDDGYGRMIRGGLERSRSDWEPSPDPGTQSVRVRRFVQSSTPSVLGRRASGIRTPDKG